MTSDTASLMNLVASTLAALATVVLAIFAKRQWRVMKESNEAVERQNTLARNRWEREDKIRAEESKPKATFGLNPTPDNGGAELWCANVGSVAFLVSAMQVDPVQGTQSKVILIDEKDQSVVPIGTRWVLVLKANKITASPFYAKAEIRLVLQGCSGETVTDARVYSLNFLSGKCLGFQPGLHEWEEISCPNCKKSIARFSVEGMTSALDCKNEIAGVRRELEASCPSHTSSNKRVTTGTKHSDYNALRDTLDV